MGEGPGAPTRDTESDAAMIAFVRSATLALLTVLSLLAPAAAQQRVEIDLEEHFPGLVEAGDSEYRQFYNIGAYAGLHGKRLDRAELARRQREWEADRAAGDRERARIEDDPQAHFLFHLERRLRRSNSYFRDLEYERNDEFAPFYLYIQKTGAPNPNYERRVSSHYGPWLVELERLFREEYAEPLGLEPQAGHGAYALFVLTSEEAYLDYARAFREPGLFSARAHYDAELQIGVTYEEPVRRVGRDESRHPALHEMVHAFQDAYYSGAGPMPTSTFFKEGLAEYLAFHYAPYPDGLGDRPIDVEAVETITSFALHEVLGKTCYLPLEELVSLQSYGHAYAHMMARARAQGLPGFDRDWAMEALYRQSYLFTRFLHHGEDGRYRDGARRFAAAVLAGDPAGDALESAFGAEALGEIDALFAAELADELQRIQRARVAEEKREKVGRIPVPAPIPLALTGELEAAPVEAAGPGRPAPEVELVLTEELRFAAALGLARRGHFDAAIEGLGALLEEAQDAALRERARRELGRLQGFVQLRDEFFEFVRAGKSKRKKLRLPATDRDWFARIEAIEDGVLRLAKNTRGLEELVLEGLEPAYLIRELGDESRYGFEAGWLLAYPSVLTLSLIHI